jgi:hypothetical protein
MKEGLRLFSKTDAIPFSHDATFVLWTYIEGGTAPCSSDSGVLRSGSLRLPCCRGLLDDLQSAGGYTPARGASFWFSPRP